MTRNVYRERYRGVDSIVITSPPSFYRRFKRDRFNVQFPIALRIVDLLRMNIDECASKSTANAVMVSRT